MEKEKGKVGESGNGEKFSVQNQNHKKMNLNANGIVNGEVPHLSNKKNNNNGEIRRRNIHSLENYESGSNKKKTGTGEKEEEEELELKLEELEENLTEDENEGDGDEEDEEEIDGFVEDVDEDALGEEEYERLIEFHVDSQEKNKEKGGSNTITTFHLNDMPNYLQFNKHVHSGYRGLMTFTGCLKSLFYLHNETVNIFTHVAPILIVILFWRRMYPWTEAGDNIFLRVLGWSHILGSITPWVGSVIYHLFMPIRYGQKFYKVLLQIDMFGIWITETFGALTLLYASTWCLEVNFQRIIMMVYGYMAIYGLYKALTAWTPLARRMCFAPVFISRILAIFLRISKYGGGDPKVLSHIILQDLVSVIGGMIGVIRIPEKWFPGKLDLFLNSHHIMHVLVVVAVVHLQISTNGDAKWIMDNYNQTICNIN